MNEDGTSHDVVGAQDGPSPQARARSLGALYICGGLLAVLWTSLPHRPDTGDATVLAMAVVAVACGAVLVSGAADSAPPLALHLLIGGIQIVISVAFVAAASPDNDIRWFYAWATPFAAFFFSRRAAAGHALWVATTLAASLAVMAAPLGRGLSVWAMTIGTVASVTVLVAWASASVRATNARSRYAALHDPLTGMANRRLFSQAAGAALDACDPHDGSVHVLLIDLDAFKLVNDTYGHQAGDELLVAFADRLAAVVHEDDTVARLGGDEFAIVCGHVAATSGTGLDDVVSRLESVWAEPFGLPTGLVYTTGSVGVARSVGGASDAHALLRDADAAMYQAKATGRGLHAVYDHRMREDAASRLELERALREALPQHQMRLVYQPVVDLRTGRMLGAEALLRWTHPDLGVITPDRFVPLAESTGLIVGIGAWVLDQAVAQVAAWRAAGLVDERFTVSVNVSGRQLQPSFPHEVRATLQRHGLGPCALALELTESVLLDDGPTVAAVLDDLSTAGLRLHLDDFGTGYSALAYLTRFPLDALKIDRGFVADLTTSPGRRSLVQAIVSMAGALGLGVVAEGVETAEQAAELARLGCDTAQGYLFARPLAADDIAALFGTDDLRPHAVEPVAVPRG